MSKYHRYNKRNTFLNQTINSIKKISFEAFRYHVLSKGKHLKFTSHVTKSLPLVCLFCLLRNRDHFCRFNLLPSEVHRSVIKRFKFSRKKIIELGILPQFFRY